MEGKDQNFDKEEMEEISRKLIQRGFLVDQDKWRLLKELWELEKHFKEVKRKYKEWKESQNYQKAKERYEQEKETGFGNGNGKKAYR